MSLQDEIKERSSQIYKESYQMSIGELINLYKDGEMDIHPEFQRLFRWSPLQKTKFIESIMLSIPIPPIFVSQNESGIWDIIDGVQRLSTIFEFVGVLKDEDDKLKEPFILSKTDYLPSFAGMRWENKDDEKLSFNKEQQLSFKRARIDVNIVKKESDPNAKYELFQRLNTGGSLLSEQEVRNCLMIMANKKFYEYVESLVNTSSFVNTTPITDRRSEQQYRMELVIRLLIAFNIKWEDVALYEDLAELLDKEMLKLCNVKDYPFEETKTRFTQTFDLLYGIFDEDTFRRYNGTKHLGTFLAAAFQTIAFGVMSNIDHILAKGDYSEWLNEKVKKLYSEEVFSKNIAAGTRAIPRYRDLSLFGREYFKP